MMMMNPVPTQDINATDKDMLKSSKACPMIRRKTEGTHRSAQSTLVQRAHRNGRLDCPVIGK
jgi:hypothetical protein